MKAASIKSTGDGKCGNLESLIQAASINKSGVKIGNLENLIKAASKDQLDVVSGNLESLIKAASIKSGNGGGKSGDNKKDKNNSGSGETTSAKSESLSCEKCRSKFPSKNKLFTHLKNTGHAIYVDKESFVTEPKLSRKEKKKKKT
jgi:hypothetical protein